MQTHRLTTCRYALPAVVSLLLLAGAMTAAHAQTASTPSPAPASTATDTTIAAPQHIAIDVAVTDKLGHRINGLQQADFTLLDNKQPAKILELREVDPRKSTADPVQIVIVIDMINTSFEVIAREREQLTEYLKQDGGHLAHPTSLAMLSETGIKLQKVTSLDGSALLAALDGAQSELRMVGRSAGFWGATDRLQWSLNQLGQLIEYESTQPGRKLDFFISPGWPMLPWAGEQATEKQRQTTFNALVRITNALREADVTLYALDPYHLGRTDPFYYQAYLKGVPNANKAEYPHLALQVLAAHTGGLVQVTGMDILGEINTAIRDADSYYKLTFEAPPGDRRDEYHDLHLQVDEPGATVRTTTGYYANTQP